MLDAHTETTSGREKRARVKQKKKQKGLGWTYRGHHHLHVAGLGRRQVLCAQSADVRRPPGPLPECPERLDGPRLAAHQVHLLTPAQRPDKLLVSRACTRDKAWTDGRADGKGREGKGREGTGGRRESKTKTRSRGRKQKKKSARAMIRASKQTKKEPTRCKRNHAMCGLSTEGDVCQSPPGRLAYLHPLPDNCGGTVAYGRKALPVAASSTGNVAHGVGEQPVRGTKKIGAWNYTTLGYSFPGTAMI